MIFVLFFSLLLLTAFCYYKFNREILSPSVMAISLMTFSCLVSILHREAFGGDILFITAFAVFTAMLAFALGEWTARAFCQNKYERIYRKMTLPEKPLEFRGVYIASLFGLVVSYFYIKEMRDLVSDYIAETGSNQGFTGAYRSITTNAEQEFGRLSFVSLWSNNVLTAFAYLYLYVFLYNFYYFRRVCFCYLIPVIEVAFVIVLTGGRGHLISITIFACVIFLTFYIQKAGNSFQSKKEILKKMFPITLIAFLCFSLLGGIRSGWNEDFLDKTIHHFILYTGSSIPALNDYFENPRPEDELFGENTLFGVYSVLGKIDKSIPKLSVHKEFYTYDEYRTNVYTVVRNLHEDYGFLGVYLSLFVVGCLFGFLYLYSRTNQNVWLIVYGFCIWVVIMMFYTEFVISQITIRNFAIIVLFYILYRLRKDFNSISSAATVETHFNNFNIKNTFKNN